MSYLSNYFNLKKSFVFYGSYHNQWQNQLIHVLFVPAIFTTALAFLSKVPITEHINLSHLVAAFYAVSFTVMEPVAGLLYAPLIAGMQYLGQTVCAANIPVSIGVHLFGWASQIFAHKVCEGRAPAFLEDPLQAVHSAVFFVWLEVLYALGYRPKQKEELDALIRERIAKMDAAKKSA